MFRERGQLPVCKLVTFKQILPVANLKGDSPLNTQFFKEVSEVDKNALFSPSCLLVLTVASVVLTWTIFKGV